ncbi:efflux RND transporter periplasmic adaptor subunit [Desulfococcaceae bacterium HSG8]|nr:efflux RND transporter periplasmic adaptor subunit [Desulfococcaceae bacterium HSG8]
MKDKNSSDKESFKRKWLRRIWGLLPKFFLIIFLIFIVTMLSGRIQTQSEKLEAEKKAQMGQEQPDVNVVTLELVPSPIRDRISLPGTTEPWVKLEILAEVSGKVIKEGVLEGDTVKAGDVIATLDSRDYRNAFNSAKASYETARSSRNRLRKLHKEQLTSRSQLDDSVAQVENYKAAMDTASLNLERCTIRAPFSGFINRVYIDKGQYLAVSDPVSEILQIDRVKVVVGIPESDVDAVRKLEDFDVRIDALNEKRFRAKKHFLSRTADDTARLYRLELMLDNPEGEILPDMFTRVEIVKKEIKESLSIPLYAVISRNEENIVYVVNDKEVHSRAVELGLQEGWRIEATSGLTAGEHVVVVGHRGVNDGQKVNVVRSVRDSADIVK